MDIKINLSIKRSFIIVMTLIFIVGGISYKIYNDKKNKEKEIEMMFEVYLYKYNSIVDKIVESSGDEYVNKSYIMQLNNLLENPRRYPILDVTSAVSGISTINDFYVEHEKKKIEDLVILYDMAKRDAIVQAN